MGASQLGRRGASLPLCSRGPAGLALPLRAGVAPGHPWHKALLPGGLGVGAGSLLTSARLACPVPDLAVWSKGSGASGRGTVWPWSSLLAGRAAWHMPWHQEAPLSSHTKAPVAWGSLPLSPGLLALPVSSQPFFWPELLCGLFSFRAQPLLLWAHPAVWRLQGPSPPPPPGRLLGLLRPPHWTSQMLTRGNRSSVFKNPPLS